MTLMYTFSRRGRVGAADYVRRGLEKRPPCLELLPSWRRRQPDAAPFTVPPPTRRYSLHGAAVNSVLPSAWCGRARAGINRYVTFLYRGF